MIVTFSLFVCLVILAVAQWMLFGAVASLDHDMQQQMRAIHLDVVRLLALVRFVRDEQDGRQPPGCIHGEG